MGSEAGAAICVRGAADATICARVPRSAQRNGQKKPLVLKREEVSTSCLVVAIRAQDVDSHPHRGLSA
eukprot:7345132-Pyramimonas_sp.AAC.1